MWPINKLTKLLSIELPIIQAPMAGAATPELVAAVSNSGGLGSLGAGYMQPDEIKTAIQKIRELTDKPFSVNLFIPQMHKATENEILGMKYLLEDECSDFNISIPLPSSPYIPSFSHQIEVILEEKIPIFSFTFGLLPEKYLPLFKEKNITIIGTATTLLEAQLLEDQGVDVIVAQGAEAGGHRGTFLSAYERSLISLMALIPQLVDNIRIPIVAAGSIMDARGIVASLALGAQGVQMGTAFLSCPESEIHPKFKEKLLQLESDETVLTNVFSGKIGRSIENKFIHDMKQYKEDILDFPIQNALTRIIRKQAEKINNTQYMYMLAGQLACLSRGLSAQELLGNLASEVHILLNEFTHQQQ